MAWATLALRKYTLRARVNDLEADLLRLSQAQQTLASSSSYRERIINLNQDYEISQIDDRYDEQVATIYDIYQDDKVTDGEKRTLEEYRFGKLTTKLSKDASATTSYQAAMSLAERQYIKDKSNTESIFENQLKNLQNETNRKTKSLEADQTQVETQLSAARAELENMSQAIDEDIKSSTIKLAA